MTHQGRSQDLFGAVGMYEAELEDVLVESRPDRLEAMGPWPEPGGQFSDQPQVFAADSGVEPERAAGASGLSLPSDAQVARSGALDEHHSVRRGRFAGSGCQRWQHQKRSQHTDQPSPKPRRRRAGAY